MQVCSLALSVAITRTLAVNIELRPCNEYLRCLETWVPLESNASHYSRMVLGSKVRHSAISCSNSSLSTTTPNERIILGEGTWIAGEVERNSESCVDGIFPVFGLSQRSYYLTNQSDIVQNFIVTPTELFLGVDGEIEARDVCNSESPNFVYTRNFVDDGPWIVVSAISFNQDPPRMLRDEDDFSHIFTASFTLDTASRVTTIPEQDFEELLGRIRAGSGVVFERNEENEIFTYQNCHDHLDRFPTITFALIVGDTRPVMRLVIFPEDYVTRDCTLTIRPSARGQRRIIGDNVLRHFVVHFDLVNRAVGFCDPI